jgi:hypothetical protein
LACLYNGPHLGLNCGQAQPIWRRIPRSLLEITIFYGVIFTNILRLINLTALPTLAFWLPFQM